MLEFTTAARSVVEEDDADDGGVIEFNINETDPEGNITNVVACKAYKPGDGQLGVLMAMTGKHASGQEAMAGVINFFASTLDDASHTYIVNRMLDRKDPFGFEEVNDIMGGLIAQWSDTPTGSRSVSSGSRKAVGQKSSRSTTKSTS